MQKIIFILFLAAALPLYSQEAAPAQAVRNRIILSPVTSLTGNQEFLYLKGTIYNVLLINLKKQERISVVNEEAGAESIINAEAAFEDYLASLSRAFPGSSVILTEYYVAKSKLNIRVNVWDITTRRVKNSFTETMPADLDLLANIEKMSANIAVAVARELPLTEREALFSKEDQRRGPLCGGDFFPPERDHPDAVFRPRRGPDGRLLDGDRPARLAPALPGLFPFLH
jgi:hypothetical protein